MEAAKKLEVLAKLRNLIPQKEKLTSSDQIQIPKGSITSISGNGKTRWVAQFLATQKESSIAWIEEQFSIFPISLGQHGVCLNQVLFIEAGEEMEWACLQVLRSQIFHFVVVYKESFAIPTLRRFQIASEKAQTCFLWLSPKPQKLWPISLEIQIKKNNSALQPFILKERLS